MRRRVIVCLKQLCGWFCFWKNMEKCSSNRVFSQNTILITGSFHSIVTLHRNSWSRTSTWRNETQYPLFCHLLLLLSFPFHLCSLFSGSHERHVRTLSCDRRRIATSAALSGACIQPCQTIMLNLVATICKHSPSDNLDLSVE